MIKGLYSAASAMLANLSRHGTLSHNVSNLDTPGFKQVLVSLDDFIETAVVDPPGPTAGASSTQQVSLRQTSLRQTSLRRIGDLGLGVESSLEMVDFTPGGLRFTGQPLDLALQGAGFFRIQTPNGERYTRDGRFIRDVEGSLVTVDGYPVLDDGGQPIKLPTGDLFISGDGVLMVNGTEAARLGLAAFDNPETELGRDLPNTFKAAGGPTGEELGTVHQGYLEMSNANPAQLMTQMVAVSRAYEASQQMVQTQDELLGKAINSLGSF
jgi:flagellar basal body rod protein FlgG